MRGVSAPILALVAAGPWVVGCAAPGPAEVAVAPGGYARAFDAATDELRRRGFGFELIDARGGLIVSAPMESAGLASPWSKGEGSFAQEVGSFLHRDRRRVTVRFDPPADTDPDADRTALDAPLTARVAVAREVLHRPGLRLSAAGVRLSSTTENADEPRFIARPAGEDTGLARAIADAIRRRNKEADDAG